MKPSSIKFSWQRWPMIGLLALAGCHQPENNTVEEPQPKVDGEKITFPTGSPQTALLTVVTAQPRRLAMTHLTGRLYWNEQATVRIFTPVDGRVTTILADLGDRLAANAPLAEIDSPDFSQALANARTAAGNLAAADKAYSRSKDLLEHGAAAQKDVEAAEAAFVAAQAEKERAAAVLANYGASNKTTNTVYILRSPLAGELVEKNLNPGQEVRPDLMLANAPNLFAPLFVVTDPTKLWLQLDIAEADLTSLAPGQQLRIHSPAFADHEFHGQVEKIGDSMDPGTRMIRVRAVVDNSDRLLKAEMYVSADVEQSLSQSKDAGVEIPAKAIFVKDNESYLFIEDAPGQYVRHKVKLGLEKDGTVPVLEGLTAGQKVVTEGALLLQAVIEPTS